MIALYIMVANCGIGLSLFLVLAYLHHRRTLRKMYEPLKK